MGVVYSDAIRIDAGNLGPEKLYVQTYLVLKIEFEGKYSGEESKDVESASGLTGAAKSLCIPLDQSIAGEELGDKKCFCCGDKAKSWTLFGRSY